MLTIKQFELICNRSRSSGLSVKEFCQNTCIASPKFSYWQRRLQEQNLRKDQRPDFVPVVFSGVNPQLVSRKSIQQKDFADYGVLDNRDVFEIIYPSGVKHMHPSGCRYYLTPELRIINLKSYFSFECFLVILL